MTESLAVRLQRVMVREPAGRLTHDWALTSTREGECIQGPNLMRSLTRQVRVKRFTFSLR